MRNKAFFSFLILVMISCTCVAQDRYLRMVKKSSNKIRIFNENKRVKIKTLSGEKYIGRYRIIDKNTLSIKGVELKLDEIKSVRNRSVGSAFAGAGIAGYGGLLVLVSPTLSIHGDTEGPIILASVGAVVISAGIFAHEIFPKNSKSRWSYEIIIN